MFFWVKGDDNNDKPIRIESIVVSMQHQDKIPHWLIESDIREKVIDKVIPKHLIDNKTKIDINT